MQRTFDSKEHDLLWECARFRTFKKWPFKKNAKCIPTMMAEAGWYCTTIDAKDASAMCVFCFKELNGWEPTDDPWEEHVKHSGECTFVKLNKREKDFTVNDIYTLLEARLLKILEREHAKDIKQLEDVREKILERLNK